MNKLVKKSTLFILLAFLTDYAIATGMQPETPVLFLDDENRETTINITNSDDSTALLHSSIQTIPEEPQNKIIVTPQIARVEAKQKQQVRVILKEGVKLSHQTLQRINFLSIPDDDGKKNRARVLVGQNIPVIISPANLPENLTPWKEIKGQCEGSAIKIHNPTDYVIRLTEKVDTLPKDENIKLPKTYILPQEAIHIPLRTNSVCNVTSIILHPVTRFGVLTDSFEVVF
ncbi:TPA: fimbria/pilus periplasmic chaperone [Enterobacter chengduensis]|nr:fimbria/pilus periplasmic chaperone [Enterobacter chengduensis]